MTSELSWFKSSYSGGAGGECIEVALDWHKSSHSGSGGGEYVEVAACPGTVHVRDSKDPAGPTLAFPAAGWSAFVKHATRER